MLKNTILKQFLEWYFIETPKGILKAWKNFLIFNLNYFSFASVLKSYFSPWHSYKMYYPKSLNFQKYFEVWSFNAVSRIIGAIVRTFLIIIGIFFEVLFFFIGLTIFLFWIFWPIIFSLTFLFAIKKLIQ